MKISEYFPIWNKLNEKEQQLIEQNSQHRTISAGTLLHNGQDKCLGLLIIGSGQLRVYITSEEGREVTLYRLFSHDTCLFSASCIMQNIQFDISIEAEKETQLWIIPSNIFKTMQETSLTISNYANDLMATRFSDVMWLIEQIMWKSLDKRLATFLVEESWLEKTTNLKITHEKIANHIGSAREVVTRMLRYFQSEGLVKLTRGCVEILNLEELKALC